VTGAECVTGMAENSRPLWPAIGTALFVLCVPGSVVGLVPYYLSGWSAREPFFGVAATRWIGLALIVCALPIFLDFVIRFAREGQGTPAPIAPTQHLVVHGSFQYVRNPGYIAVVSLILGQALLLGSGAVLVYALLVALAFHLFVLLYEEPTLRRQFGADYEAYCRKVPRWLPRRHVSG
jgi:protein-S-isoprenylcysteine O-methyltransferase Ste14